jgi:hypothetical protein
MSQGWKLDGVDFLTYGVWVRKSSGALDMPKMVDTSDNWLDLDGRDYWQPIGETLYQDNEIVLNCFIESDSYANFKTAVATFYAALTAPNQRVLTVPYLTSTIECFSERKIKMAESNYIRTRQIGLFTLTLRVRNDSIYKQITIYKADNTVRGVFNYDNKFKISKKLQGANNASFAIESSTILDIQRNDYVLLSHVSGVVDKYYLERDPEVKKVSTNKYIHQLRFEYQGYLLNRIDFLILDDAETAYWGTAEDVIDRLIENANIDYSGIFAKGTISSTININHSFSNQTCYQVLQQLAKTYELEFDLKTVGGAVQISMIPQIGVSATPGLEYGKGNGLYSITRDSINNEDLVTVLHAYGSSKNLPATYPNTRLKCPTFPLESNKGLYGAYSRSKNFDEIFPEFTGTVTAYTADLVDDGVDQRKYIIEDTAIPFDINAQLLPGLEAKVVFKTGDLSGYEFQIKRYDNTTKEIYLIEFNNKGEILPSTTIKPAIGDEYTIVDIDLPASYLTDAETRLLAAATAYQATTDTPKVTYRATVARGYQYDVVFNGYDIGDKVPITDVDFGLSASDQRISDLVYNVFFNSYELILSEAPLITFRENITQRVDEVEKTQKATEEQSVITIRKRRTTGRDVLNILTDPATLDINHDQRTRRNTIDSRHLSYEASTLDYSVEQLDVKPNYLGDRNALRVKSGYITVHNWRDSTLNRYDIREQTNDYVNPENYNPIRRFSVAQRDITLPDDDGQFIYARVPLDGVSTVATIETNKSAHIRTNYYEDSSMYKLGRVSESVDSGFRKSAMLWGNSELNSDVLLGDVIREVPTGVVDGVNVTFTLSETPVVNSDDIYINGQLRYPGTAYTLSGNTITFVVAPWSGSLILAKYVKQT